MLLVLLVVGLVGLFRRPGLGAYIDSGQVSRFTDVNITNDLVVDGATTITGALSGTGLTLTGDLVSSDFIQGGGVTTLTQTGTTTTATAAQICDTHLINLTVTNATGTNTTLLPAAADLVADCLTVNGQTKQVVLRNTGSATSTTITANTGTVLNKSGDTGGTVTMAATSSVIIDFVRLSATAVEANINYFIAN